MKKTIYTQRRNRLSEQMINAREEAGLSQQQVAQTEIVSQSELSKLENGQRRVEFLLLLDLAKLYAKSINYFIPIEE